jgi:hypothetical protein
MVLKLIDNNILSDTYLICIPILELDVDLVRTEMHKGKLIEVAVMLKNAYV